MDNKTEFRGLLTEALERALPRLPQLSDDEFSYLIRRLYEMGELVLPDYMLVH
jgi:hypothetical protein